VKTRGSERVIGKGEDERGRLVLKGRDRSVGKKETAHRGGRALLVEKGHGRRTGSGRTTKKGEGGGFGALGSLEKKDGRVPGRKLRGSGRNRYDSLGQKRCSNGGPLSNEKRKG